MMDEEGFIVLFLLLLWLEIFITRVVSNWILCFTGKGVSVLCEGRGSQSLWEWGGIGRLEGDYAYSRSVCECLCVRICMADEERNKI